MDDQDTPSRIDTIDASVLLPLVRQVLDLDVTELADWTSRPLLDGGSGHAILAFEGTALRGDETVLWSLVLKRLKEDPHHSTTAEFDSPFYWRREADAYESGLFDHVDGGFVPAPCLAIHDYGDEIWLWMPQIKDGAPDRWSLDQCVLAARHLGQFNGQFPESTLSSDWQWLSRQWLRGWRDTTGHYPLYSKALARPGAKEILTEAVVDEVERMWVASDAILDRLESLPQCLCHLDAHRQNLFAVRSQTVAIDWARVGKGAYGEDLANLVHLTVAINGINLSDATELRKTAFAAYLEGLRDAGWEGNEGDVRFGYLAHTCVRHNTMWAWAVIDLSLLDPSPSEAERPPWARYLRTSDETVLDEVLSLLQDTRAQGRELLKLLAETGRH